MIPSYTLFDAAISYDFAYLRPDLKGWKAQVNATNLTNRYYVAIVPDRACLLRARHRAAPCSER